MADEQTLRKKYLPRARPRAPRPTAQVTLFRSVLGQHAAEMAQAKKMSSAVKTKVEQDWEALQPDVVHRDLGFIAGALWARGWLDLAQYEAAVQQDGNCQPYLYVYELHTRTFGTGWAYEKFVSDFEEGLEKVRGDEAYDFRDTETDKRIELKSSRLGKRGNYIFEQIRPDYFDVCVCLGCSPEAVEYWVFTPDEIRPFLSSQHRDSTTFQLHITESNRAQFDRFRCLPRELRRVCRRKMKR
jgi:hypothetical protein